MAENAIRCETKHSMVRRRNGWDYRAPGWYMITICLADRSRGRLGEVEENPAANGGFSIALSPLGRMVEDCLLSLSTLWPGVEIGPYVVMPDHIHFIIHIVTRQKHPLGAIVGSFKAKTTAGWRELGRKRPSTMGNERNNMALAHSAVALAHGGAPIAHGAGALAPRSLWQSGYQDSILWGAERRERAAAYIADNPRRLAERQANPGLFRLRRDLAIPLSIGNRPIAAHFAAIGNHQLLNHPSVFQVQCSRRFFAYRRDKWNKPLKSKPPAVETQEFRAKLAEAGEWAASGAVIVNPCISEGEREIARRLFADNAKMILLKNKGFSPRAKPEGSLFDRCAEGRLLLLAPAAWPYVPGEKKMTRFDACALNRIAQAIAGDGAAETNYCGMRPADIDGLAMEAVAYSTRS